MEFRLLLFRSHLLRHVRAAGEDDRRGGRDLAPRARPSPGSARRGDRGPMGPARLRRRRRPLLRRRGARVLRPRAAVARRAATWLAGRGDRQLISYGRETGREKVGKTV